VSNRLLSVLRAITSATVIMAGVVFLKYAFLIEHLNLR